MKEEIWKAVKGYEGWYEVSNLGRVRSVERVVIRSDGRKCLWKGSMLKGIKVRNGYLRISLSKSSKEKMVLIHRLVAEAFLPNPNNLPEVNHKDENKTNNCVDNLEWCTYSYNNSYGTARQRRVEKLSIPVLQLDVNTGQVIAEYPSANEAGRQTKLNQGGISYCCRGECKTAYGYKWKYKKE